MLRKFNHQNCTQSNMRRHTEHATVRLVCEPAEACFEPRRLELKLKLIVIFAAHYSQCIITGAQTVHYWCTDRALLVHRRDVRVIYTDIFLCCRESVMVYLWTINWITELQYDNVECFLSWKCLKFNKLVIHIFYANGFLLDLKKTIDYEIMKSYK